MAIPLSTFITVNISAGSRAVSKQNFSIPCLIGYDGSLVDRTKRYSSDTILADLITDGLTVNHPIYKMAQAVIAQDFKPDYIVVGRRDNPPVQAIDITLATTTETISVTMRYNGVEETYTRVGTGVPATDATALAATINAGVWGVGTEIAATGVGSDVQIRQGAGPDTGQIFYFDDLAYCTLDDVTADPGLAADLTAIRAADDTWYGALLDSGGGAENIALATAIESLEKCAVVQSQDYDNFDGTAGSVLKTLSAASRERTMVICSRYSLDEYPACAAAGFALPRDPGSYTLGWKALSGVTRDAEITTAEYSNIETDRGNVCLDVRSQSVVMPGGLMPDGSWFDLLHLTDWLREEIRTRLADALLNNEKIPYTDAAGVIACGEIESAYEDGADNGGFVLDDFACSFTAAADQTTSNRTNRIFDGVDFTGTFTGAVHEFVVAGRING
jgi:hypothetical protein